MDAMTHVNVVNISECLQPFAEEMRDAFISIGGQTFTHIHNIHSFGSKGTEGGVAMTNAIAVLIAQHDALQEVAA
jgi:hypothetical protein